MAWELRGNKRYYYRSIRRGRRVTKEYFGRGPRAEQAAREDEKRRAECEHERQAMMQDILEIQEITRMTNQVQADVRLLFDAALLASGFHRNNYGQWRAKRDKCEEADGS